jgi:hypothetical protein
VLAVLTGIAIWKPVQLAPLTGLFGGYVWARYWHFVVMLLLVLLGAGHVFMVFAVDPQSLRSMVTGDYDESRSPEALNARPFLRGRRKPVLAIARTAPPLAGTGAAEAMAISLAHRGAMRQDAQAASSPSPEAAPAVEAVDAVDVPDAGGVRDGDGTAVVSNANLGRDEIGGGAGETDEEEVGR